MKNLSTFKSKLLVSLKFKKFSYKIDKLPDFLRITDIKTSNFYDFHYFWLRHQCSCIPLCKHPKTFEKTLKTTDYPISTQPISVDISNNSNEIIVKWNNHVSKYNIDTLISNNYSKNQTHYAPPQTFSLADVELDYEAFKDNKSNYLAEVKKRVDNYDLFVIRNYGLNTERIITDFGGQVFESHFGRYEDLKTNNTTNKNTDQLGYTSSDVDLHTDLPFYNTPPTWQLLQCINQADKGGENYLLNSEQLCEHIRIEDPLSFFLLTKINVKFDRKQKEFESLYEGPIISLDTNNKISIVRHSYFTMAPFNVDFPLMKEWYKAFNLLCNLSEKYKLKVNLQKGDFLMYNNYKCFHARASFEGPRHMRGVYFEDKIFKQALINNINH